MNLDIGQNNQAGKSILKSEFKEANTVEDNLKIAIKILLKTMDSSAPSPDRLEVSVLKKDINGQLLHQPLPEAEVSAFYCIALTLI